jgi:excisionase family DNA binding protein
MSTSTDTRMSTRETATYLGVPKSTLDYWAYNQTGPRFTLIGGRRRYRKADLDAWLARQPIGGGGE